MFTESLIQMPEEWREFTEEALLAWRSKTFSVRRMLAGKSGAIVLLVEVQTPDHDGLGILKLSALESLEVEQRGCEAACAHSPELARRIPAITHTHSRGNETALLMTVAAHGLLETQTLLNLNGQQLNRACQRVAEALLSEWNPTPRFQTVRADELLKELLGPRLGPESRVPDVMEQLLNLPADCNGFRIFGKDYPNPFAFSRPDFSGSQIDVSAAYGASHGDFHAENILVGNDGNLFFIDFPFFQSNRPILYDNAYLELHLLLTHRETATHERWTSLCYTLIGLQDTRDVAKQVVNSDDQGLLWAIGMLRGATFSWIDKKYPERQQEIKKQSMLARVAAGLNFANKRTLSGDNEISDKKKTFAFIYAATAAKEFFDYCRLYFDVSGPVATPKASVDSPIGSAWREVWDLAHNFDRDRGAYILIVGAKAGQLAPELAQQIGRLPWSLVLDFDPKGTDSVFASSATASLKRIRAVHQVLPHQPADVQFDVGTYWLFADPVNHDGAQPQLVTWRKQTLDGVRRVGAALHRATTPSPVTVIVLGEEMDPKRLEFSMSALQDSIFRIETIVISENGADACYQILSGDGSHTNQVVCDWKDFALGIHQMLGDFNDDEGVWIPVRDPVSKIVRREKLSSSEAALYAETLEIIPAGAVSYQNKPEADVEFLKGNVISWAELDMHVDVDRDAVKGESGVLAKVEGLLLRSRTDSFAIEHTPGAGGTTVARRVAWDLRDKYPCVILKALTDNTFGMLEALFGKTNLPILIVAEAARLLNSQRDLLFEGLKVRNVRCVILDVRRRLNPRVSETAAAIKDPMPIPDANRFLSRFEARAPERVRPILRRLATNEDEGRFRSPFFFGLHTFGKDFVRIPDFVSACMDSLSNHARHVVAQLALVKRYSQTVLPVSAARQLLGLPIDDDGRHISQLLGDAASKFVMFDRHFIWVAHPLLAEEILRQHLKPQESDLPEGWRRNLPDFCIQFIKKMAEDGLRDNDSVVSILNDLCIERSFRQDTTDRHQFSDLLRELNSTSSQRRVLQTLCEYFPDNPHFWNHLGRHMAFCGSGSFGEAEEMLLKAISLDRNSDVHHHALGMVYRKDVQNLLREPLSTQETASDRLVAISPFFSKAEQAFENARSCNPNSNYPLVSPIQMIVDTFDWLRRYGNCNGDLRAVLNAPNRTGEWCRGKLAKAQGLLAVLHHLEAAGEPSPYRVKCDSGVQAALGNYEGMIEGLSELLKRSDVSGPPIRRMLANGHLQRAGVQRGNETINSLRQVVKLMEENLRDNPCNGGDIRMWFRAYRALPEFSLPRALEQMTEWSLNSEESDAKYYLYILHFIAAREGYRKSIQECLQNIERCRRQAPVLQAKKSFEWWASPALRRPCPLVHHLELGGWSKDDDFFIGVGNLGFVEGRIDKISSPQAGELDIGGIPAFFAPKNQFIRARDLNAKIKCYLGFSYEGLRAWSVQPLRD